MARPQLVSEPRPTKLKKSELKAMRAAGYAPASIYGTHLDEALNVKVKVADVRDCVKTEAGATAIIELKIDGAKDTLPVMLKQIERDSVSRKVMHLTFQAVSMDEPVEATIPVHLVGEAPGVAMGGIIEQAHSELAVRALPGDMPPSIELDISGLNIGDSITIGSINIPKVELLGIADDVVVAVKTSTLQVEAPEVEAAEGGEEAAAEAAGGEEASEE